MFTTTNTHQTAADAMRDIQAALRQQQIVVEELTTIFYTEPSQAIAAELSEAEAYYAELIVETGKEANNG